MEQGMSFVAVGGDVGLLRSASKGLADRFKK
jgi:2-keto-3-deoxy-L-rhamnonate aldolase RhmA